MLLSWTSDDDTRKKTRRRNTIEGAGHHLRKRHSQVNQCKNESIKECMAAWAGAVNAACGVTEGCGLSESC